MLDAGEQTIRSDWTHARSTGADVAAGQQLYTVMIPNNDQTFKFDTEPRLTHEKPSLDSRKKRVSWDSVTRTCTGTLPAAFSDAARDVLIRDRDICQDTGFKKRDEPRHLGFSWDESDILFKCLTQRHCQGTVIKTHYSHKTTTTRTVSHFSK